MYVHIILQHDPFPILTSSVTKALDELGQHRHQTWGSWKRGVVAEANDFKRAVLHGGRYQLLSKTGSFLAELHCLVVFVAQCNHTFHISILQRAIDCTHTFLGYRTLAQLNWKKDQILVELHWLAWLAWLACQKHVFLFHGSVVPKGSMTRNHWGNKGHARLLKMGCPKHPKWMHRRNLKEISMMIFPKTNWFAGHLLP